MEVEYEQVNEEEQDEFQRENLEEQEENLEEEEVSVEEEDDDDTFTREERVSLNICFRKFI